MNFNLRFIDVKLVFSRMSVASLVFQGVPCLMLKEKKKWNQMNDFYFIFSCLTPRIWGLSSCSLYLSFWTKWITIFKSVAYGFMHEFQREFSAVVFLHLVILNLLRSCIVKKFGKHFSVDICYFFIFLCVYLYFLFAFWFH